ncbi:CYTH domain-containing protein [Parvibaculum sp.]|uniref:CYTH domain-containing protein n=1 Tax=Parvibaculum sp. TaxID=2024848 RepID=UPI00320DD39A
MLIEIERKFLVADPAWQNLYTSRERLRDGLLASTDGLKVRVRLYENRATLAVKTKQVGFTRAEYEYEIPMEEAEQLLALYCGDTKLAKTRYYVPYRGFTWEVDVYEGVLSGIILAEVELKHADVDVPLPAWIGREVTGEPEYKKINMLRARYSPAS